MTGVQTCALPIWYVEALRGAWREVPDTADVVMYWWDGAAQKTRDADVRRFGLITTNSLRQSFNRKVVDRHLAATSRLHIIFAIPDHPWVDSASGAAVRIAMTVGSARESTGALHTVVAEKTGADGEVDATLVESCGEVHADLTVGARVASARRLAANANLCFQGMNLVGKGFRLDEGEVRSLGYDPLALPDRKSVV